MMIDPRPFRWGIRALIGAGVLVILALLALNEVNR